MKIAVVANCQGEGLAHCLKSMNSDVTTDFCMITEIQNGTRSVVELLNAYDYVFAQKFIQDSVPQNLSHKVIYFPSIAFSAFHPDITYLRGRKSGGEVETVESLMVSYHSSIAVFGFLHGLSVDKILGFYNPYVFSRLGYIDSWKESRDLLLREGLELGMPLNDMFSSWARRGCFMYSFNHPELKVMSDLATALMKKAKIAIINQNGSQFLADPLKAMPVWPVYPEIGARHGIAGDYAFKRHDPHGVLDLRTFVEDSYANYAKYDRATLEPLSFSIDDFNRRLGFSELPSSDAATKLPARKSSNPYANLPDFQFWKKSLATVPMDEVDPVTQPNFKVERGQKIATAGSCFAQHIARTLSRNGFNYFVAEPAQAGMTAEAAHASNYGVFSARYGNVYTVRQLLQLIDRVFGRYSPEDQYWLRKDGRYVDPFRPQIEPDGFKTLEDAEDSRRQHFAAVRTMLQEMDVFVFTLGLTEGWRSRHDGAVFPLAPGVAGGEMDLTRYEFVNFTADEVTTDLEKVLERLATINPKCKVILTVSPVPLIATYEPRHALVATTYSKAVLRVAAENVKALYPHVEYFPSFEIITGSFNKGKYFEDDLRSVTDEGVAHVMRLFLKHYMADEAAAQVNPSVAAILTGSQEKTEKKKNLFDIVCDEEAIAKF
jgi:GSCFA family/Polysaccharide biosynthesis enzyme WcbI